MNKPEAPEILRSSFTRGRLKSDAHILAVGGGKGGVGKSFVSSNIAIFLSNMGFNTVLVDLDLGAANAHTTLGEGLAPRGLSDYLSGKVNNISDIALGTRVPNLRLVSGCNDDLEVADLDVYQRSRLMSDLYSLPCDYLVLDLSAGTHQSTVDFFLMAQSQMVVFTPEPSSIENAYRFMKACFFRKIKRFERNLGLEQTMVRIMEEKEHRGVRNPADLVAEVLKAEPRKGQELVEKLAALHFQIVLNQTRTYKDVEIGSSVQSVCKKFFGLSANFVGHLDYDNAVWQSLRKRKPLLMEYPHSRLYAQILNITKSITYGNRYKAVV